MLLVNVTGGGLVIASIVCFYKCEKARQAKRPAQVWSYALLGLAAL